MTSLSVEVLTRRFQNHVALDNVSIDFPSGGLYGLLGPSGSGKSTLLRLIAGFDAADSGHILVGGERVESVPVERRRIGMVFQSYALFPNMTVAGNVGFGLAVRSVARAEIRRRVAEALELVRLGHLGARRPHELSGGQRQRVALARAIVTEPRLLLLDEPLGALDRALRQEMQVELRRIQRETGLTTVFVTHDQEEALTMSDRVGILQDGRLVQEGTPDALYDHPESAFVARFLGAANLFEGTVRGGVIRLPDGTALATHGAMPDEGREVICAVRPERLRIVDPARARAPTRQDGRAAVNRLVASVTGRTFSGPVVTWSLDRNGVALAVIEPNDGGAARAGGSSVTVEWDASATIVLDGERPAAPGVVPNAVEAPRSG